MVDPFEKGHGEGLKLNISSDALIFATEKHKGQRRMGGLPYIFHPLDVAIILKLKGFSVDYQLAGLFHDLLEDTDATEEEILALSNDRVLKAIRLVTKEKGYNPKDYQRRIMGDHMALMVKLADRLHNLRSAKVAPCEFKERYIKETQEYYLDMAKETIFESEINEALEKLHSHFTEGE